MRDYLARQVDEKKQKEIEEKKIDEKQAVVWKEDTEAFNENEKNKQQYLKDVYKKHEDVLLAQMADKDAHKNRKKMNTLELLYNKALMKAVADNNGENLKKAKVWFDSFNRSHLYFGCVWIGIIVCHHVSCRLATCALSQLVCLTERFREDSFLRQALKTNLSSSHYHRKFLFFLVSGRRCLYSWGSR